MTTIECTTLALTLDECGRVTSVKHKATGNDFLATQAPPLGLWELALIRPVSYSNPLPPVEIPEWAFEGHEWFANRDEYRGDLLLTPEDASSVDIHPDGDGLRLQWSVPVDGSVATVTIHIAPHDEMIAFHGEVCLPADWAIKRFTYPCIRGFGDYADPGSDALLFPNNHGVLRTNPLADMSAFVGQYPGGNNWTQMAAWFHGDAGLYLAVRDPETNHTGIAMQYCENDAPIPWMVERWHYPRPEDPPRETEWSPLEERITEGRAPGMALRVSHWPQMAQHWTSPYPVVLQGIGGHWFDAAELHRAWATKQRWCRKGPLHARPDASSTLAELDLWFMRFGFPPGSKTPAPAQDLADAVTALHEFFSMPFGLHWYNWHNFSWHTQYPACTPVVDNFEKVTSQLQERGIVLMPYFQGRLLYRDRLDIETERTHASVETNGQPYLEKYTGEDDWPLALCPSDPWSAQKWCDAARMLWQEYGVEGVYFDQICAMPPSLCYHEGHGHPLGGGNQYWTGYDAALAQMEPLRTADTRRFLASECLCEAYMDRIDLLLSFVPIMEEYVPLFTALYGDYTVVMGKCSPTSVLTDPQLCAIVQGEQFLFGGQLGWLNEEILEHKASAVFLRNLARLRAQIRGDLHVARMERPLDVQISPETVSFHYPAKLCARTRDLQIQRAPVRHTVWRTPDGRALLLFLNDSPQEATITFRPHPAWEAKGWWLFQLGSEAAEPLGASDTLALRLPALSAAALLQISAD